MLYAMDPNAEGPSLSNTATISVFRRGVPFFCMAPNVAVSAIDVAVEHFKAHPLADEIRVWIERAAIVREFKTDDGGKHIIYRDSYRVWLRENGYWFMVNGEELEDSCSVVPTPVQVADSLEAGMRARFDVAPPSKTPN